MPRAYASKRKSCRVPPVNSCIHAAGLAILAGIRAAKVAAMSKKCIDLSAFFGADYRSCNVAFAQPLRWIKQTQVREW
jgi:hypothetical protein